MTTKYTGPKLPMQVEAYRRLMTTKPKQTCTQCGKDSADKTGYCAECDYTNMPKQAHTPTPWMVSNDPDNNIGIYCKPGTHGKRLWICTMVEFRPDEFDNVKSDASFIVRACNSHEELLTALKDLVHARNTGMGKSAIELRYKLAEEAIANAEEK